MSAQTSFWARRRAGLQAEAEAETQAQLAEEAAARAEAHAEKDDATVLEEMGLPDPAALTAGDDFAAFMAKDVPEHLKNKALRVLWRSNPVLACVDGLNEYDDDYRAAMLAAEPIKTAYQVGKGMMAHVEEMARQKEAAESVVETPEIEEEMPEQMVQDCTSREEVVAETPQEVAEATMSDELELDIAPRRMRFRFEEAAT